MKTDERVSDKQANLYVICDKKAMSLENPKGLNIVSLQSWKLIYFLSGSLFVNFPFSSVRWLFVD